MRWFLFPCVRLLRLVTFGNPQNFTSPFLSRNHPLSMLPVGYPRCACAAVVNICTSIDKSTTNSSSLVGTNKSSTIVVFIPYLVPQTIESREGKSLHPSSKSTFASAHIPKWMRTQDEPTRECNPDATIHDRISVHSNRVSLTKEGLHGSVVSGYTNEFIINNSKIHHRRRCTSCS